MINLIRAGISLILIGSVLVLAGTLLSSGNAGFGGLIMIGPIPIAFGSSPTMTVVAMVIGLLIMILFWISGRRNV